jgi:hypothetical protein
MLDIESQANCEEILSEANSFQQIGLYSKAYAKREVDLDTLAKISHLKNEISIDKKS